MSTAAMGTSVMTQGAYSSRIGKSLRGGGVTDNNRRMLDKVLAPHSERAYAILRIVTGLLFAFHGVQKVFGVLGADQPAVMSQYWIGGVIELVVGPLIAVGYMTRWAAFLASGMMAVAYFQFHASRSFFPGVNDGESAVVYSFLFLFVACKGAGRWSMDNRR